MLDLSFNALEPAEIQHLAGLPRLRHLDLSNNALVRAPEIGDGFARLEILSVERNSLETDQDFMMFASLARLRELNVSHNRLTRIPPTAVTGFKSLEWINLAHNHIASESVR